MKIYTIKDIAEAAGVGISTVSRVLNRRPDVSEETRKRVMDVVELYNYTPNNNAKNLKQRNADLVSIIIRGRQNTFLVGIAEQIIEYGSASSHNFLLDFIDESADEIESARRHIAEKKVKGIIFLGSNVVGRAEEIEALHIPCVFTTVDTASLGIAGTSSISVDNRRSAQMAIDHLIENGHRRIAVFGGIRDMDDSIGQRYRGVVDSFRTHRLPFDESLYVECSFNMEKAYQTAMAFLAEKPSFTAIFAVSDVMAVGIRKALDDSGLRVPEDVSLIGFDGIPISRFTLPTLTTIEQPAEALAQGSLDLILRLLEDEADQDNVIIDSNLIPGGSVRNIS